MATIILLDIPKQIPNIPKTNVIAHVFLPSTDFLFILTWMQKMMSVKCSFPLKNHSHIKEFS